MVNKMFPKESEYAKWTRSGVHEGPPDMTALDSTLFASVASVVTGTASTHIGVGLKTFENYKQSKVPLITPKIIGHMWSKNVIGTFPIAFAMRQYGETHPIESATVGGIIGGVITGPIVVNEMIPGATAKQLFHGMFLQLYYVPHL